MRFGGRYEDMQEAHDAIRDILYLYRPARDRRVARTDDRHPSNPSSDLRSEWLASARRQRDVSGL
jgi:hypothetical protein